MMVKAMSAKIWSTNTVENVNPVQHGTLCCKQNAKWQAYYTTQFADIVALESADAVGVAKGIEKG